jgi:hypothetical protein
MSQYPDQGWSRSITLNDGRLSRTTGVSVTYGGGWRNTLPKPPMKKWFHVVATWDHDKRSCVYLNAKLGQCTAARNGKHPSRKEQLIIGGRGPNDGRHNPSVKVHSARVYNQVLSKNEVVNLYTGYTPSGAKPPPPPPPPSGKRCPADVEYKVGPGKVNVEDLLVILGAFDKRCPQQISCEVDVETKRSKGKITVEDLLAVLAAFGQKCGN